MPKFDALSRHTRPQRSALRWAAVIALTALILLSLAINATANSAPAVGTQLNTWQAGDVVGVKRFCFAPDDLLSIGHLLEDRNLSVANRLISRLITDGRCFWLKYAFRGTLIENLQTFSDGASTWSVWKIESDSGLYVFMSLGNASGPHTVPGA